MLLFHKSVASVFGVGYIRKGSGTVAAALGVIIWQLTKGGNHPWIMILITLVITGVGIWCSSEMEHTWGHDSSKVVIDEIAGMAVSLWFIPPGWVNAAMAFTLFRFFDIVKPLFIRNLEALKSGWGVMLDDVLAGIYSNLLLHAFLYFYH